ncbi:MAG: 50S ribosomal protein L19e [Nanoarchaeota archaeon]|nr:50S ribosomal protein L19e [Nanoarchaeota archaeon]
MNLTKKKELAKKTLKVGKDRIAFVDARLDEIKEAITRQDILDLVNEGAIIVKPVKGRLKKTKKKSRSVGNIRKKPNVRKKTYVILVRKQRSYVAELKRQKEITNEEFKMLRRKIRNKDFRNKAHLREYSQEMKK